MANKHLAIVAMMAVVAASASCAVVLAQEQPRSLFSVTDSGGISIVGTVEAPEVKSSGAVAANSGHFEASLSFGNPPVDVAVAFEEAKGAREELTVGIAELKAMDETLAATDAASAALDEEQNARLEKLEADFATATAAEAEQAAAIAEANAAFEAALKTQQEAFDAHLEAYAGATAKAAEDAAAREASLQEKIDSQQKTIDMLVSIVSKFDVTADLERLRTQTAGAAN
eukprot:g438.t1